MATGAAVGQWVFSLLFGLVAVHAVTEVVADRMRPLAVVGQLFHLAMAVAMVVMVWAWQDGPAAWVQLAVFGAGAVWFGALAALRATGRVRRRAAGGHGPWELTGHAVMMLAMVWMVVVMTWTTAAPVGDHAHHTLSPVAVVGGVGATAALVVTGVLLIVGLVDCLRSAERPSRHAGQLASAVAMSLGMAGACWAMLAT